MEVLLAPLRAELDRQAMCYEDHCSRLYRDTQRRLSSAEVELLATRQLLMSVQDKHNVLVSKHDAVVAGKKALKQQLKDQQAACVDVGAQLEASEAARRREISGFAARASAVTNNNERTKGLEEEVLGLQEKHSALEAKNGNLKHNFFLMEAKYKKLKTKCEALLLAQSGSRADAASAADVNINVEVGTKRSMGTLRALGDDDEENEQSAVNMGTGQSHRRPVKRAATDMPGAARRNGENKMTAHAEAGSGYGRLVGLSSSGRNGGTGRTLKRAVTEQPSRSTGTGTSKETKYIEVVRNKADRAALPGHDCEECRGFYRALVTNGSITAEQLPEYLQLCSKHKHKHTPPDTPAGFWSNNMSMDTPPGPTARAAADAAAKSSV